MPEPFQIRAAESSDSEGIARVHTHSWQSAYRGLLPDEWLDALRWEDRKERWDAILEQSSTNKVYVATNGEQEVIGFASAGASRDEAVTKENTYELYAIYLAPEIWSKGIGKALLHEVIKETPADFTSISVWVLTDNARGREFYERHSFVLDQKTQVSDVDGHLLEEVRYIRALRTSEEA